MYSFLVCFYILDACYLENDADDLGAMLSAMSPAFMLDGMPMDRAFLDDWNTMIPELPDDPLELIRAIEQYLVFYENSFGFVLSETRIRLKSPQIFSYIETAKETAKKTCRRHPDFRG